MLGMSDDGTIGNSDMQAVWGLNARERIRAGAPLHWDGLNTSIREVVISSALGDGTVSKDYDNASMDRIERFLRQVAPPPSPHRQDPAAVARGRAIYQSEQAGCAGCHDAGGARTLTIIPAQEIGTDGHRLAMWSDAARDTYSNYREGRDWGFRSFQNVEGYVAESLDGLWLRGPYLHNGSVPTLADLLEPQTRRTPLFLRGAEVLDNTRGGFVAMACDPSAPRSAGFCHDVRVPGNGNGGHLYGTDLPPSMKADLLAYLLTL
jgi:hypothetical protein